MARLRESGDEARTVVYCPYVRCDTLTRRLITPRRAIHEGSVFTHLVAGWTIVTSAVIMQRTALLTAGGFDESLPASEDYDLWLRLAMRGTYFAPVPEALVIVRRAGPQLTANPTAQKAAFRQLDARWREPIRATCGPASYRRWRTLQCAYIQPRNQFLRVRELTARGRRRAAWRECLAMVRFVRWSRRFLVQALVLLTLGEGRPFAAGAGGRRVSPDVTGAAHEAPAAGVPRGPLALGLDQHPTGIVQDPAGQAQLRRRAVDERAEADALNGPLDPHTHSLPGADAHSSSISSRSAW